MPSADAAVRQRQQQARRLRKLAEAAIAFGCPGHSRDDIDIENLRERPNGAQAPRSHYWDPWLADWRDKQSHEPYVSREHQQRLRPLPTPLPWSATGCSITTGRAATATF